MKRFICLSIMIFCGFPISIWAFESAIYPAESAYLGPGSRTFKGGKMVLRYAPFPLSSIADTIHVPPEAVLKFNRVRFRTVVSGLFLAQTSGTLGGEVLGKVSYVARQRGSQKDTLNFAKGDTIEYLQYTGEFWKFLRLKGVVSYVRRISPWGEVRFKELRRLQYELWLELVDSKNNVRGWYEVADEFYKPQPYPNSSEWPETEWLEPDPFEF